VHSFGVFCYCTIFCKLLAATSAQVVKMSLHVYVLAWHACMHHFHKFLHGSQGGSIWVSLLQVCFIYASSMFQIYFKYGSSMVQVWFKYGSIMLLCVIPAGLVWMRDVGLGQGRSGEVW
jgi:hypothetical protein